MKTYNSFNGLWTARVYIYTYIYICIFMHLELHNISSEKYETSITSRRSLKKSPWCIDKDPKLIIQFRLVTAPATVGPDRTQHILMVVFEKKTWDLIIHSMVSTECSRNTSLLYKKRFLLKSFKFNQKQEVAVCCCFPMFW